MRVVRVITKSGEIRLTNLLPIHCDCLSTWWRTTQMAGAVVGDLWCCQFSEIAFAEIVEVDAREKPSRDTGQRLAHDLTHGPFNGLAGAIGDGKFRPDE